VCGGINGGRCLCREGTGSRLGQRTSRSRDRRGKVLMGVIKRRDATSPDDDSSRRRIIVVVVVVEVSIDGMMGEEGLMEGKKERGNERIREGMRKEG
jgi:hypothetical protein